MLNNTKYIGRDVTKLANEIKRYVGSLSSTTGISGSQGQVLHYIIAQHDDDVFQKDIEVEFNLRPASASGLIKALDNDGYITREPSSNDARLKRIILTNKGKNISDKANEDIVNFEKKLIKDINSNELDTFVKVLNQMNENIKGE